MKVLLITGGVIVCLIFLLIIFQTYIFGYTQIEGDTMKDYKDQSYHRICRICKDIKRQDVIVHNSIQNPDIDLIGRVVGLPNESVEIEKGAIKINGQVLDEPYTDWKKWDTGVKDKITLGSSDYLTLVDKRITHPDGFFLETRVFTIRSYRGKIL